MAETVRLLRRLQALLRLTVGKNREERQYPAGVRQALVRAAGVGSFDEVKNLLMEAEKNVRAYYARFVEQPAQIVKNEEEMEKM